MLYKKSIVFLLALSIVSSGFYSPAFRPVPKAEAFWGIADVNIESVPQIVKYIMDKVGVIVARGMIDRIMQSTIQWAQDGFDGNPAYVTDLPGLLRQTADVAAGEFLEIELGMDLCSPFRAQVIGSLARMRTGIQTERSYQCSITNIVANLEDFYGDFDQGGWEAWFVMTQTSANNPYGALIAAQAELDNRIASSLNIQNRQLDWDRGFMSWRGECQVRNPNPGDPGHQAGMDPGACIDGMGGNPASPVQTPGSVISSQLNNVLPSGLNQLVSAKSIDELITAFASGLLSKYVFGNQGIFRTRGTTGIISEARRQVIDIDGDGIWDGWDSDEDGDLDVCHHGMRPNLPPSAVPNNANCLGSTEASGSPYFTQLCDDLGKAIVQAATFRDFVNNAQFLGRNDVQLWSRNITSYHNALVDLVDTMVRLNIRPFDGAVRAMTADARYLQEHIDRLVKDERLAYGSGDDSSANGFRQYTPNTHQFLIDFRAQLGQCENPNVNAAGNVQAPTTPYPSTSTSTVSFPPLVCQPSAPTAVIGQPFGFSAAGGNGDYYWWENGTLLDNNAFLAYTPFTPGLLTLDLFDGAGSGDQCQVLVQ